MATAIDKLTSHGCSTDDKHKVCRSRGGESCAFDGAMIVLQPIADTAHIVHGPIACCGNSWEGRGSRSSKGDLHTRGFTTDLGEIDIVYGSEEKLRGAIKRTFEAVHPKAIFVYSTCVSGLIGEDIDAVCKKTEIELGIRVIPVNAPGFVGPKNLGNRIAGEALLEHVIGTGETPVQTHTDINLIGEYNIAGDLWLIEPLLAKAGIRILSRITGDSTFEELTWAHQAKLNVVVCGRALINVAREMERRYGIPYVEVSFFGSSETAKALRTIAEKLKGPGAGVQGPGEPDIARNIEILIKAEEKRLKSLLKQYQHLRGKRAVLYTGGVKSWSFISALQDLGVEVVAIGTKKSTFEDEEKMKLLLGPAAPLVEDVSPKNLAALLKERKADMLVAGGRNQYLAIKEGYPFVDVNQERHMPYAGYLGLINLAEQISNGMCFYHGSGTSADCTQHSRDALVSTGINGSRIAETKTKYGKLKSEIANPKSEILIDPLKHSPAIGAAMALQGIDRALPILHGGQGCTFLGKVLLTKHFREPISLASSKLFVEEVVMGSEEKLKQTIDGFIEKNNPALVGVLTSGLSEVKGDDVAQVMRRFNIQNSKCAVIHIATPDYEGGLETGYAKAVEAIIASIAECTQHSRDALVSAGINGMWNAGEKIIAVLAGPHLTPADFTEVREIVESFGLRPIMLPDLSALDGSRTDFSPLASGGTVMKDIERISSSMFTITIGGSLESAAKVLKQKFGAEYRVFDGLAGLVPTDVFLETLAQLSGQPVPRKFARQRNMLIDGMRDAHFFFGGKKVCLALEPDHAVQTSAWLDEMGASVDLAVLPTLSPAADLIKAKNVQIDDLASIGGLFDALISNSHAAGAAKRLGAPLYEMGFPVYKSLGYTNKVFIGYRGTLAMINEVGSLMMHKH